MAQSSIKVQVDAKGAQAKLAALLKKTANMQPVFAVIGRSLLNRIRLGFKLGVDPWAKPWLPLKFRKGQPLRDTGLLMRSIVSKADATGVTIGTNKLQAPVHQFGATIVPKNKPYLVFPGPNGRLIFSKKVVIPARPFLPLRKGGQTVALPPTWSAAVVSALRAYFKKSIAKGE